MEARWFPINGDKDGNISEGLDRATMETVVNQTHNGPNFSSVWIYSPGQFLKDRQNWRSLNSFWGSSSQCVPLAQSPFSAFPSCLFNCHSKTTVQPSLQGFLKLELPPPPQNSQEQTQ